MQPRLPCTRGSVKKSGPVLIGGVALVPSRKWLPWLACAAIAVAGFPGHAQGDAESSDPPQSGAVVAVDNFFHEDGSADSDNTVDIAAGGHVTFAYPTGGSSHNVVFNSLQPSSCAQTAGVVIFPTAPPLPQNALPAGWAGSCDFATPGTYTFVCGVHPAMTGKVVVAGAGTPTPTPTPTETPSQATPTPTPTEPPRDGTPAPTPKPWASLYKPAAPRVDVLLRGKLKLTARCSALDRGTATLSVSHAVAKQLKLKGTTLATGSSRCGPNNRFTVTLKATSAAKKALARSPKAVKATVTLKFPGLSTQQPITLTGAS